MKIQFEPLRTDGVAISMPVLHYSNGCVWGGGVYRPPLTDYWTDFEYENGFTEQRNSLTLMGQYTRSPHPQIIGPRPF
jgi:hypothetical protein